MPAYRKKDNQTVQSLIGQTRSFNAAISPTANF